MIILLKVIGVVKNMAKIKFHVIELKSGRIVERGLSFKEASILASDLNVGEDIFEYVVGIDEEVNI